MEEKIKNDNFEKVKYPYLPEGKTILYVSEDNLFMMEAMRIRNTQSTDKWHPTGAVIVKDGKILGGGANQSGFKNPHLIEAHANGWCVRKWFKAKSGTKYWLCPGCSTNKKHAENMAVRDAVKKTSAKEVIGADLYLYGHWWCCKECWDGMIGAGIKNVYLVQDAWNIFKS
ncbi:MAG: deaminase [Parcubacteria group bacterium]|jgi:deoxycytidylate deaminase